MNEDVFPKENGGFSIATVSLPEGKWLVKGVNQAIYN